MGMMKWQKWAGGGDCVVGKLLACLLLLLLLPPPLLPLPLMPPLPQTSGTS
jgi:hypothetical protein